MLFASNFKNIQFQFFLRSVHVTKWVFLTLKYTYPPNFLPIERLRSREYTHQKVKSLIQSHVNQKKNSHEFTGHWSLRRSILNPCLPKQNINNTTKLKSIKLVGNIHLLDAKRAENILDLEGSTGTYQRQQICTHPWGWWNNSWE